MADLTFEIDIATLKAQIETNHKHASRQSFKYRRHTGVVEIIKGGAAAFTTALLGIGQLAKFQGYNDEFQFVAIIITAALAIITAWDGLFRHSGLWLMNAKTRNELASLKDDIEHAEKTKSLDDAVAKEMYRTYKKIWARRNEHWYSLRGQDV
jgi:hypothetical protein